MTAQQPKGNGEQTGIQKPRPAVETLRDLLQKYKANFSAVMPKHLTVDRLLQVALAAVSRNPRLLSCTPASILRSLMIAAQLGLDPSGVIGSGYLVPFHNKRLDRYEATFIPGYRGLIDLARRSGEVTNVEAHVIYEKDAFSFKLGIAPTLDHIPSMEEDPGKPRGAYSIVRIKDAPVPLIEVMSFTQIEAIRKRSRAANEGPWVTDWGEMAKKTVSKRNLKYAPLSVEAAKAMAIEDRFEAGEEDLSDIVAVPDMEGEDEQPAGSKSDRVLDQLKDAKTKATETAAPIVTPPPPTTAPAPTAAPAPAPAEPPKKLWLDALSELLDQVAPAETARAATLRDLTSYTRDNKTKFPGFSSIDEIRNKSSQPEQVARIAFIKLREQIASKTTPAPAKESEQGKLV